MQWNKKLNAYTLSEIIVVLIITSIVVGLALSVLQLVQKQMTALRYNNENTLKIKSLETKLSILFNQSEQITVSNNDLSFIRIKDTIKIQFYPDIIVIEKDSISLKSYNLKTYFRGEVRQIGNVDAVSIDIKLNQKLSKPIFVYKTNDARTRLQQWE